MSHADQAQAFDPEAPFIASDGLEYEDLAAFICQQPYDNWRNNTIQGFRQAGRSEAAIREWIAGYDGDDGTPTIVLERQQDEAETSAEALRISTKLTSRVALAYARAYFVEPHENFCPF